MYYSCENTLVPTGHLSLGKINTCSILTTCGSDFADPDHFNADLDPFSQSQDDPDCYPYLCFLLFKIIFFLQIKQITNHTRPAFSNDK